ncbi:unnamed protein product [Parnassius mnemosyne]|uniref:Uncharacterized protein n=1 Tax=Parnassius mnemosyne TaxID=213953 RepID=A0AAV1KCZ7_9NEOP
MKSISFFVEPSGLDQVHFLWGRFWKKEFIIKSPSFSMKSASCWPLGFRCPIPNFPTFSSPFSLVPSFALKSPINTVYWVLEECMALEISSYISSTSSSGCAEVGA